MYGEYQSRAREVLRDGLMSRRLDPRDRAAFAVSLGLARDPRSVGDLSAVLEDTKLYDDLRGYAALGLGHLGIYSREVLASIRVALKARSSEELRRSTATALGMLRDRAAVPLLLTELRLANGQSAKGEVVMALARVGDDRAVDPLVELLRDSASSR